MNSQILFPHIGKVIASTGSRSFPRLLHDLIRTQLAVDATHITQLREVPVTHSTAQTSSLYGIGEYAVHDGALDGVLHRETSTPGPEETAAQLHLTRRKDQYRYVISVYRCKQSQDFSAQERNLLEDFSPLLLPMVEKHISAIQPRSTLREAANTPLDGPENQGMETLRQRFADRLKQCGLQLSNREMEVCIGLLAGHTAPALAEQFKLKVNTVESYLKRAAIKLGISGRHSLLRWMYAADESAGAQLYNAGS